MANIGQIVLARKDQQFITVFYEQNCDYPNQFSFISEEKQPQTTLASHSVYSFSIQASSRFELSRVPQTTSKPVLHTKNKHELITS